MRGEDSPQKPCSAPVRGSPPHARGRPATGSDETGDTRITPACAGKTARAAPSRCPHPDHPRMRGEDHGPPAEALICHGSPPHARGRLVLVVGFELGERITPACAGKTSERSEESLDIPDHPRMRGEDRSVVRLAQVQAGSPPHARGRLRAGVDRGAASRITPACAGKTRFEAKDDASNAGSPPHARGRRRRALHWHQPDGITPACAGKTRRLDENEKGTHGSPPHARGRRVAEAALSDTKGITPACAGKTVP